MTPSFSLAPGFTLILGLAGLLAFPSIGNAQHTDPLPDPLPEAHPLYEGTYSIIARDPETGELGMGVQSRAFAVGYRTWTARGGLAIFAHQAASNPYYGRVGMEMLAAGLHPQEVLDRLVRSDEESGRRQVAILDIHGRTAAFTGADTNDWKGHECGVDFCAQGNILAGPEVVDAMARTFESTAGQPLPDRLLAALDAAEAAGGDIRGMQSSAMTIVEAAAGAGGYSDVTLDLRVNDHPQPLVELRRLLTVFRSGGVIAQANALFQEGDREGGLAMVLDLRDQIPEKDNVWIALAGMYLEMDRRGDALEALGQAVETNPANRRQLPRDPRFQELHDDREFLRITGDGR
ncbi:MAG: DUF1028 domain-containing protein [Gemmatimonadales bacterium]|nr:MAG: DUF1028 domain-containing protein [Gemmatimonadales bacterium]